jgi:hypothetical protein
LGILEYNALWNSRLKLLYITIQITGNGVIFSLYLKWISNHDLEVTVKRRFSRTGGGDGKLLAP